MCLPAYVLPVQPHQAGAISQLVREGDAQASKRQEPILSRFLKGMACGDLY